MYVCLFNVIHPGISPFLGHIHELASKSHVDESSSGEMNQSEIIYNASVFLASASRLWRC